MHTDFFFSVKFHLLHIIFVTQSILATVKNPTAKLKVTKKCPIFSAKDFTACGFYI